jgi:hypothetical protein
MATITSCPRCSEKLRLPDEYRGRQVRCPQCSTVFEAAGVPAPTPTPADAGVGLNLSLDDPDPVPSPAGSSGRSKPVGAVEINMSLDDDMPKAEQAPPRSPEPPPEREPADDRPRDRNGDRERGDTLRCPVCNRTNYGDARRCHHCGERLADGPPRRARASYRDDYDDDYGYRRRRRDTEPHRGGTVLAMGIISLVGMAFIPGLPVIFGLIGWVMGRGDLKKIKANQMDPDGQGMTMAGYVCSIIGTLINSAALLFCCGFIGLLWYEDSQHAARTTRTVAPITVKQSIQKDWQQPIQPNQKK